MSIASEITRLQGVKSDILQAIADKGVTVPAGSALDDCPDLIASISGGGGGGGTVNIDGRDYRTTTIGGATWLAENLDFKFSGCGIGGSGDYVTPHAWYYNNDESTYGIDGTRKCGLLYNWYAVKFLNDNISVLVPGWHVPTNDEYTQLVNAVGGANIAGTILKAYDVSWAPSWGGIDTYGFGALPAGFRGDTFYNVQVAGVFWTITEIGSRVKYRGIGNSTEIYESDEQKYAAFSVRLVKDS